MPIRTALLVLPAALMLIACPPTRGGDDDDSVACDSASGTLLACVAWEEDGEGIEGASVLVREDAEVEPISALTGSDGCVEIDLAPGTWGVSGANSGGDCVTPYESSELVACQITQIDLYLLDWCMDGR
ncbi:MAG: hypothetical protein GY898_04440 [Proteobacteria bacterium]|nr:hypothetical protein [Pseudomonadota bacterium]